MARSRLHEAQVRDTVEPNRLRCTSCQRWKPDDGFARYQKNKWRRGRQHYCRDCQAISSAALQARKNELRRLTRAGLHVPSRLMPPRPPRKPKPIERKIIGHCHRTDCDNPAIALLTNGVFLTSIPLSAVGRRLVAEAKGAPVCETHYQKATERHPCSTEGCHGWAPKRAKICGDCAHRSTQASQPPRPSEPFLIVPERKKTNMEIRKPDLDPTEENRLRMLNKNRGAKKYDILAAYQMRPSAANRRDDE